MGMAVEHFSMCMEVAVEFRPMPVLMVFVMEVSMFMLYWFVPVFMGMAFSEVKPHPSAHQRRRNDKAGCQAIAEHEDGEGCANERRHGKVRPCPRRS
jgi:hypothetical protein